MNSHFRDDSVQRPLNYRGLFAKLWPYFMEHKAYFLTVVISMLLLTIVGRLLPFLFGYAIDHGIMQKNHQVITYSAIAFFVLQIGQAALNFLHSYLFIKMGNKILYQIRERLISHVQRLPTVFFDTTPTGRVVTRITNDVLAMGELFTEGLIMVITNALTVLAIVISMLWISPKLTVISLAVAPPMIWLSLRLSQRIQNLLRESKKKMASLNAFVAENLNGIKVLQLHNRTRVHLKRFEFVSHEYTTIQMASVRLYALLWPAVSFFFAASLAAALYYGGWLHHEGQIALGAFITFLMNVQDFFPPLRSILEKYQQFQNSLTGAERVFSLLQEEPEQDGVVQPAPSKRLSGRVEFQNVSFHYHPDMPPVLENLSFTIEPGQSLAIVGRTGSGKTTIISLLQRLYENFQGQILIDGQSLLSYPRRELRSRIGVVQQDNFVFRGTLAENVSLFNPLLTREMIHQALEISSGERLLAMSGGLEARVEERGANLSVGERQLIAFARVLAYNPDLLILDEATANIDSQSEELIQQATQTVTQGRTSIIIAHRLSTILHCDQILVLDQGQLKEIGSHQELIAQQGAYYQLYQNQFDTNPSV